MALTSFAFLGLFMFGIALGAVFEPVRFSAGDGTGGRFFATILLAFGHSVVVDQDLRRRGLYHKGFGYLVGALCLPPLAVLVYLLRVYPSRAITLFPLYLGVVGTAALLGYGMGWLYLRV